LGRGIGRWTTCSASNKSLLGDAKDFFPRAERDSSFVVAPSRDRPTIDQIYILVADAAGVSLDTVLDGHVRKDVFQVTVYLLRRACNLPIKQVAALDKVSVPGISKIQGHIEDSGGLGRAFHWARKLEK
jgi:hypothetical protein